MDLLGLNLKDRGVNVMPNTLSRIAKGSQPDADGKFSPMLDHAKKAPSREERTLNGWLFSGAVEGGLGVVAFRSPVGLFGVWSTAGDANLWSNRDTCADLIKRALLKLGYHRDRRFKSNWRYDGRHTRGLMS